MVKLPQCDSRAGWLVNRLAAVTIRQTGDDFKILELGEYRGHGIVELDLTAFDALHRLRAAAPLLLQEGAKANIAPT